MARRLRRASTPGDSSMVTTSPSNRRIVPKKPANDHEIEECNEQQEEEDLRTTGTHRKRTSETPEQVSGQHPTASLRQADRTSARPRPPGRGTGAIVGMDARWVNLPSLRGPV